MCCVNLKNSFILRLRGDSNTITDVISLLGVWLALSGDHNLCSMTMRTAGRCELQVAAGRSRLLCLKSCGGTASMEAGGTKVWKRRNGHQREMESSFSGGSLAHKCTGCLHWAKSLHTDAFQRSRWAHQIQILLFMLDFSLPKCMHMCFFLS